MVERIIVDTIGVLLLALMVVALAVVSQDVPEEEPNELTEPDQPDVHDVQPAKE